MESSATAGLHADMPQHPAARTETRTRTEDGSHKSYRESTPSADTAGVLALQHALFTHPEEQHAHLPSPVLSTELTSPICALSPLSSPTLGKAGVVLDQLLAWGLGGSLNRVL